MCRSTIPHRPRLRRRAGKARPGNCSGGGRPALCRRSREEGHVDIDVQRPERVRRMSRRLAVLGAAGLLACVFGCGWFTWYRDLMRPSAVVIELAPTARDSTLHLSPSPASRRSSEEVAESSRASRPTEYISTLVDAVNDARGYCPVGEIRMACLAHTCAILQGPLDPGEYLSRYAQNPSLVLDNVALMTGIEVVDTPCARGRELLQRPEAHVAIVSSRDGWTCMTVEDHSTPVINPLDTDVVKAWCDEARGVGSDVTE